MQEVNGDSRISNAFDFWKSSQYKKAAAVALVVFALSTSLSLPFIFYSQTIDTEQIVDRGGGNKTITNTKVTTTPHEVSATYFIIPGLAILILLVPMLRKVNLGPLELELAEPVTSVAK